MICFRSFGYDDMTKYLHVLHCDVKMPFLKLLPQTCCPNALAHGFEVVNMLQVQARKNDYFINADLSYLRSPNSLVVIIWNNAGSFISLKGMIAKWKDPYLNVKVVIYWKWVASYTCQYPANKSSLVKNSPQPYPALSFNISAFHGMRTCQLSSPSSFFW